MKSMTPMGHFYALTLMGCYTEKYNATHFYLKKSNGVNVMMLHL